MHLKQHSSNKFTRAAKFWLIASVGMFVGSLLALHAWPTLDDWLHRDRALPNMSVQLPFIAAEQLRLGRTHSGSLSADGKIAFDNKVMQASIVARGPTSRPWPFAQARWSIQAPGHLREIRDFVLRALDDRAMERFLFVQSLRRARLWAPRVVAMQVDINGQDVGDGLAFEQLSAFAVGRSDAVALHLRPPVPTQWPGAAMDWLDPQRQTPTADLADSALAPAGVERALWLLRHLLRGDVSAGSVVNVHEVAALLALTDIWQRGEIWQWPTLQWLYDPKTDKLRPLVQVADDPQISLGQGEFWPHLLLADPKIAAATADLLYAAASPVDDWLQIAADPAPPWQKDRETLLERARGRRRAAAASRPLTLQLGQDLARLHGGGEPSIWAMPQWWADGFAWRVSQ